MVDDRVLKRFLALEAHKMNQGLVTEDRRVLTLLLLDDAPAVRARDGRVHRFDPDSLARFAAPLSRLTRARLELPITFRLSHEVVGSCSVDDPVAREALAEAGIVTIARPDRLLWLGVPLARRIAEEHPTIFQFQYG